MRLKQRRDEELGLTGQYIINLFPWYYRSNVKTRGSCKESELQESPAFSPGEFKISCRDAQKLTYILTPVVYVTSSVKSMEETYVKLCLLKGYV